MSKAQRILEKQLAHVGCLAVLVLGVWGASRLPGFSEGRLLGLSTDGWAALCVANAIAHQVFVWICWRLELHAGALTRRLGANAFASYAVVFAILICARPLLVSALAVSNAGTLPLDPTVATTLSLVLALPLLYLGYSVRRYFGFRRAFGADHFDPAYRDAKLVRAGIFRFTPNAMYVCGFFALWIPALLGRSVAACAIALFSHLYIWVHYYCTEKPDMRVIYGSASE